MMVMNRSNEVFVARRIDTKQAAWQMPQGGIDIGEIPSKAALREIQEETGIVSCQIIAETKRWYSYDIPKALVPKLWNGKYRGQRQKWFLMRFVGSDSEINIRNTEHPEFLEWRWVGVHDLLNLIVPFKRKLYTAVLREFSYTLGMDIQDCRGA